ncbi:hypothetical protein AGMMS50276_25200 [Synergistales bacterium]|nr:hypothetical protein AGMMS50276_25200 [Synergistales bacterium]
MIDRVSADKKERIKAKALLSIKKIQGQSVRDGVEMTIEEINAEIAAVRAETRQNVAV